MHRDLRHHLAVDLFIRLSLVHLLEHQDAAIPRAFHSSVYCGNIYFESGLAPLHLLVVRKYKGRQRLAVL